MAISLYDGNTWRKAKNIWCYDGSNWKQAREVWEYDGNTWRSGYKREIQTWATIKITDIGSYQGTSSTGGNWTQEPNTLTQGAWTSTGWYGGVMLLTRPTIGQRVVSVDDYKLTVVRQTAGYTGNSNIIRWRGVNKTSTSGDRPVWTTSGSICDMNITGNTGTKSTESGGLEKDSAFKDVLKAWLSGSFANIGTYAGDSKPNQTPYLKINNITLEVKYTYVPN